MIKKNDFVLLVKKYENIEINSVGIVKDTLSNTDLITVFFIGKKINVNPPIEFLNYLDITKTGKPNKYKICNVCHILKKDFEDFVINQTDAQGRKTTRPSCRTCRTKIDGVKLKSEEKKRLDEIKPTHFFLCPICGKGSIPDITANLVRDHDHLTGEAREWLCDSCNTGLGRFKDDIELLKKAIKYLKKHTKQLKK